MTYRLGVDVGGTFTDLVLVSSDGTARTCKVLSSTADYAEAIVAGARTLLEQAGAAAADVSEIIHGTTVATNAILERRGAATGLLTTEGFRDLLEIGRLRLARLYDMNFERPAPLVRRRWRCEVRERMNHRGEVLTPLDLSTVHAALDRRSPRGRGRTPPRAHVPAPAPDDAGRRGRRGGGRPRAGGGGAAAG